MHALVIGATGATGKDLIELLLRDHVFTVIEIFVRRRTGLQDSRLKEHVINFDKPEEWKPLVKGDVLFSCLGTTIKAAGSKEAQWKIDYDYQYEFAKAARENQVPKYVLVSSGGANSNSFIFYTKMKGKLEEAVKGLNFRSCFIFRPPILDRKNSDRAGERMGLKVIRFFNRLGLLRSQQPLKTEKLAQAMINAAKSNRTGNLTLNADAIRRLEAGITVNS